MGCWLGGRSLGGRNTTRATLPLVGSSPLPLSGSVADNLVCSARGDTGAIRANLKPISRPPTTTCLAGCLPAYGLDRRPGAVGGLP